MIAVCPQTAPQSIHAGTITGIGTYTFTIDGNLASDGTYTYEWDFLNRLIRVDNATDGKLVVAYGYDAFNRRVVKVFPDNVANNTAQANRESWHRVAAATSNLRGARDLRDPVRRCSPEAMSEDEGFPSERIRS